MREIKFRAKDYKGNWVYGTYAYGCFYPDSRSTYKIFLANGSGEYIDEDTLGQYTGLKDKNGKEIYEGDIVNVPYNRLGKHVVTFKDGKYNTSSYNVSMVEVIGNIYENSDLLPKAIDATE